MLTAGITLMKFGVIPLYNPKKPSVLTIVRNTPVIVVLALSTDGCATVKGKKS